jgi:hypothetical protein
MAFGEVREVDAGVVEEGARAATVVERRVFRAEARAGELAVGEEFPEDQFEVEFQQPDAGERLGQSGMHVHDRAQIFGAVPRAAELHVQLPVDG